MKWVRIYALREQRKPLLEWLQRAGMLEIETAEEPEEGFVRLVKEEEAAGFERSAATARQALTALNEAAPHKGGLLSAFSGRREMPLEEFEGYAGSSVEILQDCKRLLHMQKRREECRAEMVRIRSALDQLEPWRELDVPFGFTGTKTTAAFIGSLPAAYTPDALMKRLAETTDLVFDLEILGEPREQTCLFAVCPREQEEQMEQALRGLGFSRPPALGGETTAARLPREDRKVLLEHLKQLEKESADLLETIKGMADRRQDMETIVDYYTVRAEKYRVIGTLDHSRSTFIITGYIPEVDLPLLTGEVEKRFTAVVEAADADPETAPVKLQNNALVKPAESITEMYAMPLASDIDPTPVLSFFFYLFFGMMLSDAGYGLLLVLGCWYLIKKCRPEPAMRRNLQLFLYCGVSTIIWGLIFGSFFGDIIPTVAKTFFGAPETFAMPALLNPIEDSIILLVLSLALGMLQILAGLGCRFYMQWRSGDKWGAVFDSGFWMTALVGASILAVGMIAVPALTTVGGVLFAASLLGLVLTQGRKKKGPMKVLSGLASLYDITGYVSDLMSYTRLMALGLTTGVLASVFNLLGAMFGKSVMGAIMLIVIFVVGHAVNLGINALGAYVHTIRLQYVELFGKFYEGGGRLFRPFAFRSQYIRIREEKQR